MDKNISKNNGLRMYFFVMGNLSGRQQGIQAGHAALEYQREFGKKKQYKDFVDNHKTFILLDGGGSNDMLERMIELEDFGIDFSKFYEPDLNESLSAIAFILPESIYDCKDKNIDPEFRWSMDKERFHNLEVYEYIRKFRLASN